MAEEKTVEFDTSTMSDAELAEITGGSNVTTTTVCPDCGGTKFKWNGTATDGAGDSTFSCKRCGKTFENSVFGMQGALHVTTGTFN